MTNQTDKKYSPLTQYIYWLKQNSNVPFPEDAKKLYFGSVLNVIEDDWQSCLHINSLLNEDPYLMYSTPIDVIGSIHKHTTTNLKPQFIKSQKTKYSEIEKIFKSKFPHLKYSDISLLLDLHKDDMDSFLEMNGIDTKQLKVSKVDYKNIDMLNYLLEQAYDTFDNRDILQWQYMTSTNDLSTIRIVFINAYTPTYKPVDSIDTLFNVVSNDDVRKILNEIKLSDIPYMIFNLVPEIKESYSYTDMLKYFKTFDITLSTLPNNIILVPIGEFAQKRVYFATESIKDFKRGSVYDSKKVIPCDAFLTGSNINLNLLRDQLGEIYTQVTEKISKPRKADLVFDSDKIWKLMSDNLLKNSGIIKNEMNYDNNLSDNGLNLTADASTFKNSCNDIKNLFGIVSDDNDEVLNEIDKTKGSMIDTSASYFNADGSFDIASCINQHQGEKVKDVFDSVNDVVGDYSKYMIVDSYFDNTLETATMVLRKDDEKKVVYLSDFYDVYFGANSKSVAPKSSLTKDRIKFSKRWDVLKDSSKQSWAADLNLSVHKKLEWKQRFGEGGTYPLRVLYLDIEIYTGDTVIDFSKLETEAKKFPINLFTLYDTYENVYNTYTLNLNNVEIDDEKIKENLDYSDECNFSIHKFDDEREMMRAIIDKINALDPDIITGWNSNGFDLPYIKYRCSCIGVPFINKYGHDINIREYMVGSENRVEISFKNIELLDYLDLYKNLAIGKRESYKLGYIGSFELGIDKLELDENMTDVFDNDIERFIAYNINDVHLVRKLDDKLRYIELLFNIIQLTNISWGESFSTLRIMDGIIYTYLYSKDQTFKSRSYDKQLEKESLQGAYVRTPIAGIFDWLADLDLSSLYPHIIARYNLSPDTYVCRISKDLAFMYIYDRSEFLNISEKIMVSNNTNLTIKVGTKDFDKWITTHKYIVTVAGTVFKSHDEELSVLYEIIDMLIKMRGVYKKKRDSNVDNQMLYDRYNNMQSTYKIVTNSLYGAMGNAGFRFFNNEVAQTITATGQEIAKLGGFAVNDYLAEMVEKKSIDISDEYTITPSFYEKAEGILEHIVYGDSVLGDSLINTQYGQIPIESVFNMLKTKHDVVVDDCENSKEYITLNDSELFTETYDAGNCVELPVSRIVRHRTYKDIYEITTETGKKLKVTEDHSVAVIRNGELCYVSPKNILPIDMCITRTN